MRFLPIVMMVFMGFSAWAGPVTFTYQGVLTDTSDAVIANQTKTIVFSIYDPSKNCLLYQESQSVTTDVNGVFSATVGTAVGSAARVSGRDQGLSMAQVFSEAATATLTSGTSNCPSGYTPSAHDIRYLRITVDSTDLAPDLSITGVPYAMQAENATSLQGLGSSSFAQINATSPAALSQANLESVFSTSNYPKLTSLLAGSSSQYVQQATNGSVALPSFASMPASPAAGQMWYDSSGVLKFWNGSSAQTLGTSGAGIASLSVGTGLTPAGTITTSGSIAVDVGTAAGQIVQVQTGGKLPALDGSSLTNLSGSAISSGTIGGTTAINTSGAITTSGGLSANAANLNYLKLTNGSSQTLTIQPSATIFGTPTFTWPSGYPGAAGFVLSSDTSGNMSWVAQSASGLSAVSNTATLTSGKIWVGSGGNLAQEVAVGGDVSLTNSGVATVGKIQGTAVSSTAPTTAGQVLRYSAGNWAPGFVSMFDLRSTATGLATFGSGSAGCTSNQTLTWTAATDNLACTNILLPASQMTGTLPVANGGTGATSFTSGQLITGGSSAFNSLTASGAGALVSASGAPAWTSGATANRLLRTNGSTVSFALADLTTDVTNVLPIANGGTGSSTQTWVDLSNSQTVPGVKYFTGGVGIGTTVPAALLDTESSSTTTSGTVAATKSQLTYSPSVTWSATAAGVAGYVNYTGTGTASGQVNAVYGSATSNSSSIVPTVNGVRGTAANQASGTITNAAGGRFAVSNTSTGQISNAYGVLIDAPAVTAGSIGTFYGLYISTPSLATNNYALYSAGGTNFFAGNVGIGVAAPANPLSVNGYIESTSNGFKYPDGTIQVSASPWVPNGTATVLSGVYTAVGIGTTTPRGALDVRGPILTKPVSNATATVDFGTSNLQYTGLSCGFFNLYNLADGGSYTFVVKGTTSATCSFNAYSDAGTTLLTLHLPPDHGATIGGKHTIYNLMVVAGDVYVQWTPGY